MGTDVFSAKKVLTNRVSVAHLHRSPSAAVKFRAAVE
jgi:hypothetical protein